MPGVCNSEWGATLFGIGLVLIIAAIGAFVAALNRGSRRALLLTGATPLVLWTGWLIASFGSEETCAPAFMGPTCRCEQVWPKTTVEIIAAVTFSTAAVLIILALVDLAHTEEPQWPTERSHPE